MHGQMVHSRTQLVLVLGKLLMVLPGMTTPPRVSREPNPAYVYTRLFINLE